MSDGKGKPPVRCFTSILDGGTMLNGYYRNGTVYINRDLAGAGYLVAGADALPDRLVHVALEEFARFVTNGATDNSRDRQNFLLDLAVQLGRKRGTASGCTGMDTGNAAARRRSKFSLADDHHRTPWSFSNFEEFKKDRIAPVGSSAYYFFLFPFTTSHRLIV